MSAASQSSISKYHSPEATGHKIGLLSSRSSRQPVFPYIQTSVLHNTHPSTALGFIHHPEEIEVHLPDISLINGNGGLSLFISDVEQTFRAVMNDFQNWSLDGPDRGVLILQFFHTYGLTLRDLADARFDLEEKRKLETASEAEPEAKVQGDWESAVLKEAELKLKLQVVIMSQMEHRANTGNITSNSDSNLLR